MTYVKKIAAVAVLSASFTASTAAASTFDIAVNFGAGLTASQQAVFTAAESFWESNITGYQTGISIASLNIDASGPAIDGPGGILGRAGPTAGVVQGGYTLPTDGIMEFDSADLAALEFAGTLLDVILHEMAHVMGFGTLWQQNGVYVNESGRYTGAAGLAAYQAEFDAGATFIPVDIVSGLGTRNSHWDEGWAGGSSDLMTGFLNTPTTFSNTTLQSFVDLGYCTAQSAGQNGCPSVTPPPPPIPLPATAVLLLTALGGLGFAARRRKQA